jgi:hypothetical protein
MNNPDYLDRVRSLAGQPPHDIPVELWLVMVWRAARAIAEVQGGENQGTSEEYAAGALRAMAPELRRALGGTPLSAAQRGALYWAAREPGGAPPRRTSTWRSLEAMGLVRLDREQGQWIPTDAGRAALPQSLPQSGDQESEGIRG